VRRRKPGLHPGHISAQEKNKKPGHKDRVFVGHSQQEGG